MRAINKSTKYAGSHRGPQRFPPGFPSNRRSAKNQIDRQGPPFDRRLGLGDVPSTEARRDVGPVAAVLVDHLGHRVNVPNHHRPCLEVVQPLGRPFRVGGRTIVVLKSNFDGERRRTLEIPQMV